MRRGDGVTDAHARRRDRRAARRARRAEGRPKGLPRRIAAAEGSPSSARPHDGGHIQPHSLEELTCCAQCCGSGARQLEKPARASAPTLLRHNVGRPDVALPLEAAECDVDRRQRGTAPRRTLDLGVDVSSTRPTAAARDGEEHEMLELAEILSLGHAELYFVFFSAQEPVVRGRQAHAGSSMYACSIGLGLYFGRASLHSASSPPMGVRM